MTALQLAEQLRAARAQLLEDTAFEHDGRKLTATLMTLQALLTTLANFHDPQEDNHEPS